MTSFARMLLAVSSLLAVAEAKEPPRSPEVRALLINGGGSPSSNYLSHLHHLQDMAQALHDRGIAADRIDVFCSDGKDAKADMAVRSTSDPDFWLIDGTPLGTALGGNDTTNTVWPGVALHAARLGELRRWFAKTGPELRPGDTLFVFVTDHGSRNEDDPDNGLISLWNGSMSVLEFRALLSHLRPGVRVVNVMSQCYSGAFADAMAPLDGDAPDGDVCGFYSTTRDRQAYGCYPEGRDGDRLGHAFGFIDAMARHPSLDDVHDEVEVADESPDVPLRTSDAYLATVLDAEGTRTGATRDTIVDAQLRLAWKDRGRFEPEIRLLDRLGEVYGTFSPRTLAELDPHIEELLSLSKDLDTYRDRWRLALDDLRRDNAQQFIDSSPEWKERIDPKRINVFTADEKKGMLADLLPALKVYSQGREEVWKRLRDLRQKYAEAGTAKFRVDIRLAALGRMRLLLLRVAGTRFLEASGDQDARRAIAKLLACERTPLGTLDPERQRAAGPAAIDKLEPFEKDLETVRRVLPSWLGINFRPVGDEERKRHEVARGAVVVQQVYPASPAEAAGIRPGDLILGPPGTRFAEPTQIREWTMNSPRDEPLRVEILREDETQVKTVSLAPYPAKIPALPAPPKEGDDAPPLDRLVAVRSASGEAAQSGDSKRMLFFWATWCGPCKSSLPELLAWSAATKVPVVAVSDEDPETIRKFLAGWTAPFPERVASDDLRTGHLAYGVSGTPTFVLVDERGKIAWRQVGYSRSPGLAVPGWTWPARDK